MQGDGELYFQMWEGQSEHKTILHYNFTQKFFHYIFWFTCQLGYLQMQSILVKNLQINLQQLQKTLQSAGLRDFNGLGLDNSIKINKHLEKCL